MHSLLRLRHAGFCGETEEEHADTLSLLADTKYEQAFMFAYSLRERTHAARHLRDDVPEAVKQRRLQEVIATFRYSMLGCNKLNQQLLARARHNLPDGLACRRSLPPSEYSAVVQLGIVI